MYKMYKYILKYRDIIKVVLMSLISYLAFLIYFRIIFSNDSYNFMLSLLFFFLCYFYNKENIRYQKCSKRTKIIVSTFSFILSFILIVGSIVSSYLGYKSVVIFNFHNIIYSIVGIIGFYFLFKIFVCMIIEYINKVKISGKRKFTKKMFVKIMIIIFVCWLPYFLRYFPAVMTPDSYYSLHYIKNGILNDYHTFGHTWFVGFFILIGKLVFGKFNYAVAFYIVIQMLINSFIFTFIIKFLYEKNVKKIVVFVVGLFFCFSPLYAIYSVTLWRDVLFGIVFVMLFISLYNYVDSDYKLSKKNVMMYLVSVFVMLFFRNNGIYVFLLFVPIFVLFSKYNRKIIAISNIIIIIMYFLIKGPVFDYFEVQKTTSSEAYSIPLQQIARVVSSGANIEKKDYKYLNKVIDMEQVSLKYNPTISDPIKRLVNNEELSKDKLKFFKAWFKLFLKYPRTYVEAYLCQTLGYWYPDVIYWATAGESKSIFKDVDVYSESKVPDVVKNLDIVTSRKLPLSNLIWSLGIMFILLIFSVMLLIYKKQYRYILCYTPLICLWLTIMVATPVFSELRYVYGLFTCVPLIIICPLLKKNNGSSKSRNLT